MIPDPVGHPVSRSSVRAAVIILVILVFSSGCVHGLIETDLFAAKINNDGTLAWVQVIDSGNNDVGANLTERPDGDFIIMGGSYQSFCGSENDESTKPYEIRLSSQGKIVSIENFSGTYNSKKARSDSLNNTGWFSITTDDASQLLTYQKVKGGAIYIRLQKTDAGGKKLWDTPFLTMKYRAPPKNIWERLFVQGIVPTSDKGYIVWGYRERSTSCG